MREREYTWQQQGKTDSQMAVNDSVKWYIEDEQGTHAVTIIGAHTLLPVSQVAMALPPPLVLALL